MNNDTTNIIPGTPSEPLTPEAVNTPVETTPVQAPISFDSPAEVKEEVKTEEVTPVVEVAPVEAPTIAEAAPVESAPVDVSPVVETPTPEVSPIVEESAPVVEEKKDEIIVSEPAPVVEENNEVSVEPVVAPPVVEDKKEEEVQVDATVVPTPIELPTAGLVQSTETPEVVNEAAPVETTPVETPVETPTETPAAAPLESAPVVETPAPEVATTPVESTPVETAVVASEPAPISDAQTLVDQNSSTSIEPTADTQNAASNVDIPTDVKATLNSEVAVKQNSVGKYISIGAIVVGILICAYVLITTILG